MKTKTFADFMLWYRGRGFKLFPDPAMWRKYLEKIDLNRKTETYCVKTESSYNSIKAKLTAYENES